MRNTPVSPAVRPNEPADPQGIQGNIPSPEYYIKISKNNAEKSIINNCKCYLCKDSEFQYKYDLLIEDNSPLIYQLFGKDLTK